MTHARREVTPQLTVDRFTSVLAAEAQAREAIHACRQQHDQAINEAQIQAARIHDRANGRIKKIQAAQAAYVKALAQPPEMPEHPTPAVDDTQQEDKQLRTAVDRLSAQLTGEPE